ncbi:MAG: peptide chain release factor N(5)-glutamine methyltransferase [Desulfobacterales bacterium]|nr:peptide chain release factor N(5)-glutamine methyltransferase [Desulfobacterales bacterium]
MADWTIKSLLSWTEGYFTDHDIDSPRLTAEILLSETLELRRLDLYLQHDRPLEKQELAVFKTQIKRRVNKEPVAYITGQKGFFNDRFSVTKGVLIPRPDTEVLVETAMEVLNGLDLPERKARVIELGVGSGAVIVSIANACPDHLYFGSDLSDVALSTAALNAKELAQTPIAFFKGSWLDAVSPREQFDLILSNPPYIPSADIETLAPEIKDYEPRMALDGGEDGLDSIRIILAQAGGCLHPGGQLIFEMGYDQKPGVARLAERFSWVSDLGFVKDLAGHNRLAVFKK